MPTISYAQDEAAEILRARTESSRAERYIRKVYAESGIKKRHCVVPDFLEGAEGTGLFRDGNGSAREPSTGERNAFYVAEAKRLVPEVSRLAIESCPGIESGDITHVITVSCTGFFNPGPDLLVIEALGLPATVQRYHLGFMGCYAAFPALKMASQFCDLNPSANVLIVCLELCSLHLQNKDELDTIVANSVFADGAAAAVVSAKGPVAGYKGYELIGFSSRLAPEGSGDMAWDIGDEGFNLVLSKYVARIIGSGIRELIEDVFEGSDLTPDEISQWAVHPGGRAILDKVEGSLELEPEQISASRHVLAQFGNMSSATILFVLSEIFSRSETKDGEAICAMAFGPGLTIETGVMRVKQ